MILFCDTSALIKLYVQEESALLERCFSCFAPTSRSGAEQAARSDIPNSRAGRLDCHEEGAGPPRGGPAFGPPRRASVWPPPAGPPPAAQRVHPSPT